MQLEECKAGGGFREREVCRAGGGLEQEGL